MERHWKRHSRRKILHEAYSFNEDTLSRMGTIGQSSSNIDLIIGSSEDIDSMRIYRLQDTWGSDHYPLVMEWNTEITTYTKKTNRISNKKTKWEDYGRRARELWERSIEEFEPTNDELGIMMRYNIICESMIMAIEGYARKGKKEDGE